MAYAVDIQPVQSTCGHCSCFEDGLCNLKAEAGWGNSSYVRASRPACGFFDPADPDLAQLFAEYDELVESRPYLSEEDANIFDEMDDEFEREYEYVE